MILKLKNSEIETAEKIREVFQISYAIEAKILNAVDFPPLKRPLESYQTSTNDFFVFIDNDDFAGIIEMDNTQESTHIQSLVVHPDHFRKGIGKSLVDFVLKLYHSKNFTVETGLLNKPAIKLYEKCGFTELKQYDTDHGVRKIRMSRTN